MTVGFNNFKTSFGYQQHECHRCWSFATCCTCNASSVCYFPGASDSDCASGPLTGTLLFSDMPAVVLTPGQSATVQPNGATSCNPASRANFGTPSFPLGQYEQTFTCKLLADGSVQATNVQNPGWNDESRTAGSMASADGVPTSRGCSVATATYKGAAWTETGGTTGCPATTGPLNSQGTFTTAGYCCVGVVPTNVFNAGNSCFGHLSY